MEEKVLQWWIPFDEAIVGLSSIFPNADDASWLVGVESVGSLGGVSVWLLAWVELGGGVREHLDGEGQVGVVPEDGEDGLEGHLAVPEQVVGDGHLPDPQHAAPAAVAVVESM